MPPWWSGMRSRISCDRRFAAERDARSAIAIPFSLTSRSLERTSSTIGRPPKMGRVVRHGQHAMSEHSTNEHGPDEPQRPDDHPMARDGEQLPPLSDEDLAHLASLERTTQLIRDRVAAVADRTSNGFYLYGPGGVSKSFTVLQELERLRAEYVLFNSRATGRGLFNVLQDNPDAVVVLEDMEPLFRDRGAQGVLRSALWGQQARDGSGRRERLVTWTTPRHTLSFLFTGGIIVTANRPLDDWPELAAIKTRIAVMQFQPSQYEVRALMRSVARRGHVHEGIDVPPVVCAEVCEFVIAECRGLNRPLDMRLLVNAIGDFVQATEHSSGCGWRDLVAARIRERPTHFREPVVVGHRDERKQKEIEIAREICATTADRDERVTLWRARTGKSQSAFYRRVTDLHGATQA